MRKMMGLTENYDIDSHYEDSVMGDVPGETVEPEEDYDDLIEFDIPDWAVSALINGDYSGLSDEEESELNAFVDRVVEKYGNAHFMVDDYEKSHLGFLTRNDINSLGGDCTLLKIRPSSMDEGGFQGEPNFQLPAEGGDGVYEEMMKEGYYDDIQGYVSTSQNQSGYKVGETVKNSNGQTGTVYDVLVAPNKKDFLVVVKFDTGNGMKSIGKYGVGFSDINDIKKV